MTLGLLFGAATALAIVPGFADLANGPKVAVLGIGLALLVREFKLTVGAVLLISWLGISCLAMLWTPAIWDGLREIWFLILFLMAYALGQSGRGDDVLLGAAYGTLVSVGLAAVDKFLGFSLVAQAFSPSGLFSNKNFLGEACALLAVWTFTKRQIPLGALLSFGVLLTSYRAGALALALAALFWIWLWRKDIALGLGACLGLLAWAALSSHSLGLRWEIWTQTLAHAQWFGWGTGAFNQLFPSINQTYDLLLDRPEHPHNELVNLIANYGVLACFPLALYGLSLVVAPRATQVLLVAAAGPLFFAFPLQTPVSLLVIGLAAGAAHRQQPALGTWLAGRGTGVFALLAAKLGRANSRGVAAS